MKEISLQGPNWSEGKENPYNKPRGRNLEKKPTMAKRGKNNLPQGSTSSDYNLPACFDRVKAPLVGAGPKHFGEGQTHARTNS